VTDKDGGAGSASFVVMVGNVDPTAEIDLSGATIINGQPTIVGELGVPVDFRGDSSDPGSDDLTFGWAFGEGGTATETSLVAPPLADAFPSPAVMPRVDVANAQSHTYDDACLFEGALDVGDDDLGTAPTFTAPVLITGNADASRQTGWWSKQFQQDGAHADFTQATLACYLEIVRFGSAVFDEAVPLSTLADADDSFKVEGGGPGVALRATLERELLAAWLNFANGVYGYDDLVVDVDGDLIPDLTFGEAVADAEATYLDPAATPQDLVAARQAMHQANRFG
jgi:hypothetical protein